MAGGDGVEGEGGVGELDGTAEGVEDFVEGGGAGGGGGRGVGEGVEGGRAVGVAGEVELGGFAGGGAEVVVAPEERPEGEFGVDVGGGEEGCSSGVIRVVPFIGEGEGDVVEVGGVEPAEGPVGDGELGAGAFVELLEDVGAALVVGDPLGEEEEDDEEDGEEAGETEGEALEEASPGFSGGPGGRGGEGCERWGGHGTSVGGCDDTGNGVGNHLLRKKERGEKVFWKMGEGRSEGYSPGETAFSVLGGGFLLRDYSSKRLRRSDEERREVKSFFRMPHSPRGSHEGGKSKCPRKGASRMLRRSHRKTYLAKMQGCMACELLR